MKHNLKNRPTDIDIRNLGEVEAYRSYEYRMEKWFEGFEKELREMLPKEEDCTITSMHSGDVKTRIALWNMRKTILEILGEVSSQEGSVKYSARNQQ